MKPLRLGVMVSGRGTNLQAILDAIESGQIAAEVARVVCNHEGAQAITRAEQAGSPVRIYSQQEYGSRRLQQRAIASDLIAAGVELVVCAGWDRVLTHEFVGAFRDRIINVHPSILPAFAGSLHAIREALAYGVKITGCTVHIVTDEVDAGPILLQAAVQVSDGDTEETLAERIHIEEHRLLLEAIRLFIQERQPVFAGGHDFLGATGEIKGNRDGRTNGRSMRNGSSQDGYGSQH